MNRPVKWMMPAAVVVFLFASAAPGATRPAPATQKAAPFTITAGEAALAVVVDVADAPGLKQWATDAAHYAIKWYPDLVRVLDGGAAPAREIELVFRQMKGIAFRRGNTITIAATWVNDRPDDFGMVVHELVHVIQDYPGGNPGWLVEGIADYVRYYVVEPGSRHARFDPERSTYARGYQPAAAMLNWLEKTSGPGVVAKLNRAMRGGSYSPEAFRKIAGDDPESLWKRFCDTLPRRGTTQPEGK